MLASVRLGPVGLGFIKLNKLHFGHVGVEADRDLFHRRLLSRLSSVKCSTADRYDLNRVRQRHGGHGVAGIHGPLQCAIVMKADHIAGHAYAQSGRQPRQQVFAHRRGRCHHQRDLVCLHELFERGRIGVRQIVFERGIIDGQDLCRSVAGCFACGGSGVRAQDGHEHVAAECTRRIFAGLNGNQRTFGDAPFLSFCKNKYISHSSRLQMSSHSASA